MIRFAKFTLMLAGMMTLLCSPRAIVAQDGTDVQADSAPATYDLRPKFKAGQKSRYEFWTKRDQTMTMTSKTNTQSTDVKYVFQGEVTWVVKEVNHDGSASCIMTLDWITADATVKNATTHNDSRQNSGDSERMHKLLRAIATVPMAVQVAADGSITGISGVDAVKDRAGDMKTPTDLDFMETASDLATIPFAIGDATIGRTWDAHFTWSHDLGKMDYDTTYTFDSVETIAGLPIANVSSESELELHPDEPNVPEGGPEVNTRLLSADARGQVMLDLERGEVVGRNNWQSTQIQTDIQLPDQVLSQRVDEVIQSQVLRISEE